MALEIINAILLFALSIPIVMRYRILPVDGTPYWLFGVLFLVLMVHCVVAFVPSVLGKFSRYRAVVQNIFLIITLCIVVGGSSITAMVDRAKTAPVYGVHDIILQQEAAMRYVITGKNPYKETYFGTPVESFHYAEIGNDKAINPALYHFVMPPWYLMFPFAFYYTVRPMVGFFDGRMVSLFTMGMLLVACWDWFKDKQIARLAIILSAMSPAVIDYFIEGRSDVFALSWLVVSLVLLQRRLFTWSAVVMMLAFLSKQTTWFILPFYGLLMWKATIKRPSTLWSSVFVACVTGLIITLPFFLWDPKAFLDSVIFYLNGSSAHSYPVAGYGLSMVLYAAGVIRDLHAYYPFIIWQVICCGPLFFVLMRSLWKEPTQTRLMLAYAVFLMVFWYVSRYFNNSHLGYLSMLFVLAGLKGMDKSTL
jgi:hypothetical protein